MEDKKNIVKNIVIFMLLGMIISLIFHYISGYYLKNELFTFLNSPDARFGDWLQDVATISNYNPYLNSGGWHYNFYPPFAYQQVYFLDYFIINKSFLNFSILICSALALLILLASKKSKLCFNNSEVFFIICAFLFSFPMFFLIDRGNIAALSFIYLFLALIVFSNKIYYQSFFIGLAAATKIFPAIFLLKYFFNKEWKALTISLLTIIMVSFFSFILFKGNLIETITTYYELLSGHSKKQTFTSGQPIWWTLDLFSFLQIFNGIASDFLKFDFNTINNLFGIHATKVYWFFVIPIFILGSYIARKFDYFNLIVFYILSMIFIQPYSYVYHLSYALIPIVYYMFAVEYGYKINKYTIILLIILILPKEYSLVNIGLSGIGKTQLSSVLNPIIIMLIFVNIFYNKIRNKE